MNCINCGKEFSRGENHQSVFFAKYCSKKCGRQYYYKKNKNKEKANNQRWYQQNRESEIIKNAEYRKLNKELFSWYHDKERFNGLKSKILDRDDHKCRFCGGTRRIAIHHIDGKNHLNSETMNNKISNLLTLCSPCHHKLHWFQKKQNKQARSIAEVLKMLKKRQQIV